MDRNYPLRLNPERVERLPSGGVEAVFRFAPDFAGFQGHFPGDPILPGVVQIMAAVHTAGLVVGRPLCLAGLKRCKFMRPVRPLEEIKAQVSLEGLSAQASLSVDGEPCAVLSFSVKDPIL